MRVVDAEEIHGHAEKTRESEGLDLGRHLLQMATQRFLAFVDAGDDLGAWRCRRDRRGLRGQRAENAVVVGLLERQMQQSAALEAVVVLDPFQPAARPRFRQGGDVICAHTQQLRGMKERPGAFGIAGQGARLPLGAQPRTEQAKIAAMSDGVRLVLEHGTLDEKPHGDEACQRRRGGMHWDAIRAAFDLVHHSGPTAKGQDGVDQEALPVGGDDAEGFEGALDGSHGIAPGCGVGREQRHQPARPGLWRRQFGVTVERDHRRVKAALALGHGPVGHALIEKGRRQPDHEWVHLLVDVDVFEREQQVAQPNRGFDVRSARNHCTSDQRATCLPERLDLARFGPVVACEQAAARGGRRIGAEAPARSSFVEQPAQQAPPSHGHAVGEHHADDVALADRFDQRLVVRDADLGVEHGFERIGCDAPALQRRAVVLLCQIRLAAQPLSRGHHGLFEATILEGMEGVVVDEDGDRPLRRKGVRGGLEGLLDGLRGLRLRSHGMNPLGRFGDQGGT